MLARLLTALVTLAGVAALAAATDGFRVFTTEGARRLDVVRAPRSLPEAELVDHLGRKFGWSDFAGEAVLVEFVFTTCPDVCQKMSSDFGVLARADLGDADRSVRLVSVTFDPENDTLERLNAVARSYGADGDRWRFARIENPEALRATLDAFGIVALRSPGRGFVHNAAIHGLDPSSKLARIADITEARVMLEWARRRSG